VTIALVLAAILSAESSGPLSAPLPSSGQWVLDYGETQCSAVKKYKQSGDPLTLAIRPSPVGDTYEFLLGRNRGGPVYASQLKGSIDFGPGPIEAPVLHYGGKGQNREKIDAYSFRIPARAIAAAKTAETVRLQVGDGPDVSLVVDNMSPLFAGLEACVEDLKRYWNYDGEKTGLIAVRARGDIRHLFKSGDYPDEALWRGQEGAAQFLLLVDEKGSAAGCHVVVPSGVPVLDAMGCQVIRERVKMKPARDHQGRAVRSAFITPPVSWRMASDF